MTRLDAINEPSMEDILASIRKIIAEDPPGSRAAPNTPPVATRASPVEPSAYTPSPANTVAKPSPQASVFSHAPQRDPLYDPQPTAADPVLPTAFNEPAARATPQKADTKSFLPGASSFFPKDSTVAQPRVEPSFARPAQPAVAAPDVQEAALATFEQPTAARTEPTDTSMLSVDAQLSDLLGDVIHAPLPIPRAEQHPAASTASTASTASAAVAVPARVPSGFPAGLSSLTSAPQAEAAPRVEHRDGFTVSRVAFGEPAAPQQRAASEPDPFDFDLGPSPFESKPTETMAAQPAEPPTTSVPSQPAFAAPAVEEPAVDVAAVDMPAVHLQAAAPPAAQTPAGAATPEPEPLKAEVAAAVATPVVEAPVTKSPVVNAPLFETPVVQTPVRSRLDELVAAAPRVQPSVAATMMPRPATPAPTSAPAAVAPVVAPVPAASQPVSAPEQTLTQFLAASVAAAAGAEDMQTEPPAVSLDAPAQAAEFAQHVDTPAHAAQSVAVITEPVPVAADHAQRSMEDTVAELLRPMLRTWLAENMPRIVERALRREVAEQMQSSHKSAAE